MFIQIYNADQEVTQTLNATLYNMYTCQNVQIEGRCSPMQSYNVSAILTQEHTVAVTL